VGGGIEYTCECDPKSVFSQLQLIRSYTIHAVPSGNKIAVVSRVNNCYTNIDNKIYFVKKYYVNRFGVNFW
jgi:hypothetical protein